MNDENKRNTDIILFAVSGRSCNFYGHSNKPSLNGHATRTESIFFSIFGDMRILLQMYRNKPTLQSVLHHKCKSVKPATVRLLTHVLRKPIHFFFHSFIATMPYCLQTSFNNLMKDWADKYHVWGTPTRSPSRSNSR